MSKREVNQYFIGMNPMDIEVTEKDLEKAGRAFLIWLKRNAKKQEEPWEYKVWLIVSTHDGGKVIKWPCKQEGRGRPKYYFRHMMNEAEVPPHIHILIRCSPGEELARNELRSYWDKKYKSQSWFHIKTDEKKGGVKGVIAYMENQILKEGYKDRLGSIDDWDYQQGLRV